MIALRNQEQLAKIKQNKIENLSLFPTLGKSSHSG